LTDERASGSLQKAFPFSKYFPFLFPGDIVCHDKGQKMNDQAKTNPELLEEISTINQNNRELEPSEAARKQADCHQHLAIEILAILNDPSTFADSIDLILSAIKRETCFDAVGIRLRSGNDFPYFVQNGFSHDFLLTENTLIAQDSLGGPCRDENGNVSLECTCGLVLSGKADPTNPLFTEGGSCWTNNSLPLLDLPAEQDPRLHPRNKCIHQGYCSVALIPIRANRNIVGLLQLNDRRKDCFTLDMIHFYEGISASIGVALMRKQAEKERERLITELETTLSRVKQLEGIIPICSYCKKIRDDQDDWHGLEKYITDHSEALFSHSICPACFEREIRELKSG
jgi:hypothetical protein